MTGRQAIIDIGTAIAEAEAARETAFTGPLPALPDSGSTLAPRPVERTDRSMALQAFDVARELPALLQLAGVLAKAKGMLPRHLKEEGEGAIVAALLAGRELGIPPMVSLRNVHVIDGRVGLDAALQLALCTRAGVTSKWIESTAQRAVLRMTRHGHEPHEQVYTIEDAKEAGLLGKDNWRRHPKAMLRARCASAAIKAYAADVVTGVYTPDEIMEIAEGEAPRGSRINHPVAEQVVHNGLVSADVMAEAKAREAAHVAETKPIVDGWYEQLKTIAGMAKAGERDKARQTFHAWVDVNGWTYQTKLPKAQHARAWGFIRTCFMRLTENGAFAEHPYSSDNLLADLQAAEPTESDRAEIAEQERLEAEGARSEPPDPEGDALRAQLDATLARGGGA